MSGAKWNHMMDVAFTIPNSPHENWEDVPYDDIIAALESRVKSLKLNREQGVEPFGFCDTYREPQPHGPLCASRACGECTCGEFEMQLAAAQTIPSGESRKCAKCGFNISEYAVGEILCGACLNDQPCALCGHRYEAHEPDMQCHDGEAHGNRCACRTFVPSGEKEEK